MSTASEGPIKDPNQLTTQFPITYTYECPIMSYELFTSKAAKFGSPQVTIRSGKISFNADAGDDLAKTGMKFAHILWDSSACKVAIRPVAKEDDSAYKMTVRHLAIIT